MTAAKPESLPNTVDQCHSLIQELLEAMGKKNSEIAGLEHHIQQLLKHRFGQRADRIDPDAPGLFTREEIMAALLETKSEEPPKEEVTYKRAKRGHGRSVIPDHLPVEEIVIDIDDTTCDTCGEERVKIGEERSERLEYIPASLKVQRFIRPVYGCPCECSVVTAEKPPSPIEKCKAGPGLLAQVAVSKYGDHLPLNRQTDILQRHGVKIARSTQADWMRGCAELVAPLVEVMKQEILATGVIASDDTVVKVQAKKKTRNGRIWSYGNIRKNLIVFDFTPDRTRAGPTAFLEKYHGVLQADAYSGYNEIIERNNLVTAGCWAHARRYFAEAQDTAPVPSLQAVVEIRKLYAIEKAAKEAAQKENGDLYEERSSRRQEAKAILENFYEWLASIAGNALPKSPIGKAITYALNNREALCRYVEYPECDIDNNFAERSMRHSAVGRKNWLFVGSDRGGQTCAILSSLIYTAKLHNLDLFAYMRDILDRLPTTPLSQLPTLLPHRWKPNDL